MAQATDSNIYYKLGNALVHIYLTTYSYHVLIHSCNRSVCMQIRNINDKVWLCTLSAMHAHTSTYMRYATPKFDTFLNEAQYSSPTPMMEESMPSRPRTTYRKIPLGPIQASSTRDTIAIESELLLLPLLLMRVSRSASFNDTSYTGIYVSQA